MSEPAGPGTDDPRRVRLQRISFALFTSQLVWGPALLYLRSHYDVQIVLLNPVFTWMQLPGILALDFHMLARSKPESQRRDLGIATAATVLYLLMIPLAGLHFGFKPHPIR